MENKYKVDFINTSYRRFYYLHEKEINKAIRNCLSAGRLTLREDVWELEKRIAELVGVKYGIAVNSGTDALFLSLLALGIKEGDEVITVSNTFIATIQAIVHCGATTVLVDVKENEQMDLDQVETLITPKTKAIIPVDYTGAMVDMDRLMEIANKYNIRVVEDSCQAVGASWNGRKAGSFGEFGCFSFNTAKLLGGMGDGGMVVTNDRELYEKVCLLRNHWNIHQLSVNRNDYPQPKSMEWAWKSRLDNVNAAFINVKLNYLGDILKRRNEIAEMYLTKIIQSPKIQLPIRQEGRIWQEFHIDVQNRDSFKEFMEQHGIETLTRDTTPNHKMEGLGLDHFSLPVTEYLAKVITRLPLYSELTDREVKYIINTVNEFIRQT